MYEKQGFINEVGWEITLVDCLLGSEIGAGSTGWLCSGSG